MNPIEFLKVDNGGRNAAIFFHGYGASQEDLYPLHAELRWESCDFYFPNGVHAVDLGGWTQGRSWFDVQMAELQRLMLQGKFREFKTATPPGFEALINHVSSWLKKEVLNKYDNVILGGFSQGAMMAGHLIAKLMDEGNIIGGIFFSGQLLDEKFLLDNLARVKTSKRPYIYASHGKQDPILSVSGGKELFEAYQNWGCAGKWVEFHGQHTILGSTITEVGQIFSHALTK